MAISGTAFAQGLLMGAGKAGQNYVDDMRRQRLDTFKMKQTFDAFKKQTDYSTTVQAEKEKGVAMYKANLADITTKNTQREEWERVSKMDVGDIIYENALKASEKFAKADRPAFVRDYMRRRNGIDKATAINDRGLTLPDYSKYKGKDEYKDAIPTAYLAGVPELPNADSLFTYDPEAGYLKELQTQADKLTDAQRKQKFELQTIKDSAELQFGYPPSDKLAALILGKRSKEGDTVMKGADVISMDNTRISTMAASKRIYPINGELKLTTELTDEERELLGLPSKPSPDTQPIPTYSGKDFTEPTVAAYIDKEQKQKEKKAMEAASASVGKNFGKEISYYKDIQKLQDLTEKTRDNPYLYGDASWKGLGVLTDRFTELQAKYKDDPVAKEALEYLAHAKTMISNIKHDLYGSAQTATELKDFEGILSRPGFFQNPDTLLSQLEARKAATGSFLTSSISMSDREYYRQNHPEASYLDAAFGLQQETPAGETNQTVSDSAAPNEAKIRQDATAFVEELIKAGEYDESERQGLIDHFVTQSLKQI